MFVKNLFYENNIRILDYIYKRVGDKYYRYLSPTFVFNGPTIHVPEYNVL